MPSKSKKQHNFMEAIAHSPAFAKKAGVPISVGKDFANADKGKTFKKGGIMATKKLFGGKETYSEELKEAKAIKSGKITPKQYAKGEESENKMNCGGKVKKMAAGGKAKVDPKVVAALNAQAARGPAGATPTMPMTAPAMARPPMAPANPARPPMAAPTALPTGMSKGGRTPVKGDHSVQKKDKVGAKIVKMASGGSTSSRGDGIAQRGKTKTKYC